MLAGWGSAWRGAWTASRDGKKQDVDDLDDLDDLGDLGGLDE